MYLLYYASDNTIKYFRLIDNILQRIYEESVYSFYSITKIAKFFICFYNRDRVDIQDILFAI